MLAMQYSIQLPHGYDDTLITQRVEQRSKLFDDLPGMIHKTFLYNRDDKLYAPFYVWQNLQDARDFLMDNLFKGVIESFRRPRVRDWFVLEQTYGNRDIVPDYAIQEIDLISAEENLEERIAYECSLQRKMQQNDNLYYHLLALDPNRWEIIRYHLWRNKATAEPATADCIQTYEVLHVSEPGKKHSRPILASAAEPALLCG